MGAGGRPERTTSPSPWPLPAGNGSKGASSAALVGPGTAASLRLTHPPPQHAVVCGHTRGKCAACQPGARQHGCSPCSCRNPLHHPKSTLRHPHPASPSRLPGAGARTHIIQQRPKLHAPARACASSSPSSRSGCAPPRASFVMRLLRLFRVQHPPDAQRLPGGGQQVGPAALPVGQPHKLGGGIVVGKAEGRVGAQLAGVIVHWGWAGRGQRRRGRSAGGGGGRREQTREWGPDRPGGTRRCPGRRHERQEGEFG